MEIDIDEVSFNSNCLHQNVSTNFNYLANHLYTIKLRNK